MHATHIDRSSLLPLLLVFTMVRWHVVTLAIILAPLYCNFGSGEHLKHEDVTVIRASDKDSEVYKSWFPSDVKGHPVEYLEGYRPRLDRSPPAGYRPRQFIRVIQGTDFSYGNVEPVRKNGFLDTVVLCYLQHHNLVIRPDDVWIAILTQFSLYINKNAEEFRDKFVNFTGKKTLKVELGGGSIDTVSYPEFVKRTQEVIEENIIDKEIREWIQPNFTTTTDNDKVVAGITLMATLSKYFDYKWGIACGIPEIRIEGTRDDWQEIVHRLDKLRQYKLEKWVDNMLKPILGKFVKAKSGDIENEFWGSIVNAQGICGGPIIRGWITVFAVFNKHGDWQGQPNSNNTTWPIFEMGQFPPGVVEVDILLTNENVNPPLCYNTTMFAGHVGREILPDKKTLKPAIGWGYALLNSTGTELEYWTGC